MYYTLKTALHDNNIEEFEKILQHVDSVPFDIENEIISGKKEHFLKLLVKNNLLSEFAQSLSGCFDDEAALAYKIKKYC